MEREKKRKRAEKTEARKGDDKMKSKGREPAEEVAAAAEASPPPTEEEVEEFFAILRRMRVAVKYFEKEAFDSTKSGAYETQSSAAAEADGGGGKVKGGLELDLNAVPEAER
ncbi:hypothetical protein C2S51_035628 [Perilla frutescens var. frutescens]|nr:hypothetical protein C2S51_035628 [Perilla frutescens var. frutescens]